MFIDFAPYWTSSGNMDESMIGSPRRRSVSRTSSPDMRQFLPPLPMHIAYDLKFVKFLFSFDSCNIK